MISLQVLNKVLQKQQINLISDNELSQEYFVGYEEEYIFVTEHYEQYKKVPDKETFLAAFPEFELFDVTETDSYLIDKISEEYMYYKTVPVIQKAADLLKTDAQAAAEYLVTEITKLSTVRGICGTDIIQEAKERLDIYKAKVAGDKAYYIPTGFDELDTIINGWARGEEFVVIFARTGQGKSWVLIKTLSHAWQKGFRVGYISPEMGAVKTGYRFDTLINNFSNSCLIWGNRVDAYDSYIKTLDGRPNPFIVATPADFNKRITVTKIKNFCKVNKVDILGIDGLTYLTDERNTKGNTKTITLTNISEDLMELSMELQIPILVAVQSNRGGVKSDSDDGTPELEHIRDSDGIAQNSSKVLSLRQKGAGLEMGIKKHRDGSQGEALNYFWDIDHGIFNYIPAGSDGARYADRTKAETDINNTFKGGGEEVF